MYDSAGVRIRAVPVPHGEWKVALAYVIELPSRKLVISGDTRDSEALRDAARDADVLVHESYPAVRLKPEDRPGGEQWPAYMRTVHTSDEEVGELAARADVPHARAVARDLDGWHAGGARGRGAARRLRGAVDVARDLDVY